MFRSCRRRGFGAEARGRPWMADCVANFWGVTIARWRSDRRIRAANFYPALPARPYQGDAVPARSPWPNHLHLGVNVRFTWCQIGENSGIAAGIAAQA